MDCCGLGHLVAPPPSVWSTQLVSVGAMLAGNAGPRGSTAAAQTAETTAAALAILRNSISVDVHSHGGKTGIISKARDNRPKAPPERNRGEEDNAPSHDWIEGLAGVVFQSPWLRYSGLNAAPQHVASRQTPRPRHSPRVLAPILVNEQRNI